MCLGYIDTTLGQWVCEDTTLEGMGNTLSGNTTHFTAFSVLITDTGNNNNGDGGSGFDLNLIAAIVVPVVFVIVVLVIVVAVVVVVVTYIVRRARAMGKSNIINYNVDSTTL